MAFTRVSSTASGIRCFLKALHLGQARIKLSGLFDPKLCVCTFRPFVAGNFRSVLLSTLDDKGIK